MHHKLNKKQRCLHDSLRIFLSGILNSASVLFRFNWNMLFFRGRKYNMQALIIAKLHLILRQRPLNLHHLHSGKMELLVVPLKLSLHWTSPSLSLPEHICRKGLLAFAEVRTGRESAVTISGNAGIYLVNMPWRKSQKERTDKIPQQR